MSAAPPSAAPGPRPLWIPPDVRFDSLPQALQAALVEIINPLYREQVLEAPTELERAAGLTLVHLAWLEVLEQLEMGRAVADGLARGEGPAAPRESLGRHMRLVGAKDKWTRTLLHLKAFQERHAGWPARPPHGPAGGA